MTAPKHPARKVQSTFTAKIPTKCKQCHMSYFSHIKNDVNTHKKYHTNFLEGPSWLASSACKTLKSIQLRKGRKNTSVTLISVDKSDSNDHLKLVMKVVNNELNAVAESEHWKYTNTGIEGKAYLAIAARRVVGVCTIEPIVNPELQCRWMVFNTQELVPEQTNSSIKIGISRIWVAPNWRRLGIAQTLLDAVREYTIYGVVLNKHELGFSQPSSSGGLLSKYYNGKMHKSGEFLIPVYLELPQ